MKIARVWTPDEIDAARDVVTATLLAAGHRQRGATIRFPCPAPTHDDRHPSADWHVERGAWICRSRQCHARYGGGALALARLIGASVDGELAPAMVAAAETARAAAAIEAERAAAGHDDALDRLCAGQYDRACAARLWAADDALAELGRRRISRECAAVHLIGVDPAAPVRGSWRALVWPWMTGYEPVSFQLRNLAAADHGDRYRWHGRVGQRGARLYTSDATRDGRGPVVVVEGFLKAMTLWSAGWRNVAALVNSGSLDTATAARLAGERAGVVIAPDPDVYDAMAERARAIPGARIVRLPAKPDDLVVDSGVPALGRYIAQARGA